MKSSRDTGRSRSYGKLLSVIMGIYVAGDGYWRARTSCPPYGVRSWKHLLQIGQLVLELIPQDVYRS
jgi:hypothetical protein